MVPNGDLRKKKKRREREDYQRSEKAEKRKFQRETQLGNAGKGGAEDLLNQSRR